MYIKILWLLFVFTILGWSVLLLSLLYNRLPHDLRDTLNPIIVLNSLFHKSYYNKIKIFFLLFVVLCFRLFQLPIIILGTTYYFFSFIKYIYSLDYTDKCINSWVCQTPNLVTWFNLLSYVLINTPLQIGFICSYNICKFFVVGRSGISLKSLILNGLIWFTLGVGVKTIQITVQLLLFWNDVKLVSSQKYYMFLWELPTYLFLHIEMNLNDYKATVQTLRLYKVLGCVHFNPNKIQAIAEKGGEACKIFSIRGISKSGDIVKHHAMGYHEEGKVSALTHFTGVPLPDMEYIKTVNEKYWRSYSYLISNCLQIPSSVSLNTTLGIASSLGLDTKDKYQHLYEKVWEQRILSERRRLIVENWEKNDTLFFDNNLIFDCEEIDDKLIAIHGTGLNANMKNTCTLLRNSWDKLPTIDQIHILETRTQSKTYIVDLGNKKYTELTENEKMIKNKLGITSLEFKKLIFEDM